MLPLDTIWAMETSAFALMLGRMRQADPAALWNIAAGPADDAERSGLPVQRRGNVAIVQLAGPMVKRGGFIARLFGLTSTLDVQRAVQAAAVDDDVETIVLMIDSPGGSVAGLAELADTVFAARRQKPVIAQIDGMATSAAYYIASQATVIHAGRADLVGSIGTRMILLDMSKMFEDAGIETVVIDTGEFKSAGVEGTEITERQRADFQRVVDGFQADFVAAIDRGRQMTKAQIKQVSDGRVFRADEALDLGLVDAIKPADDTLAELQSAQPTRRRRTAAARARVALMARHL